MKFRSAQEFLDWEDKRVTLLGMSGVGKTTLTNKLPKDTCFHFSADYRIGTRYMAEPILDNVKLEAMKVPFLADLLSSDSIYIDHNITVNNLAPISSFLGKLGSPEKGGLELAEFKRRQRLHRDAEIATMLDIPYFIDRSYQIYGYRHFINDASGSLCEVVDFDDPADPVIKVLTENTVILYLEPTENMLEELIRRALAQPKPLYFQEPFLDRVLPQYLAEKGLSDPSEIDPDDYGRWVFPRLVKHRTPLYERFADLHGYRLNAVELEKVTGQDDFTGMIVDAIENDIKANPPLQLNLHAG